MQAITIEMDTSPQQINVGNNQFTITNNHTQPNDDFKKQPSINQSIHPELCKDANIQMKLKQLFAQNKNIYWTTKVLVIAIMVCVVWLGKKYATPSIEVDKLSDPVHDATKYLNNEVNKNHDLAIVLQISSSLIMDFSFFALCIYWVLKINSGRVIFAMACFYVFRGLNQALVIFPFPEGYYWENPSFPSYVTPYGKTSDFFYSGHVGFLNLCALEWYKQKRYFMVKLTCAFNVYIAFVMLIFRIHYAVDITTGLVVSHWIYMIVSNYDEKIDSIFRKVYNWAENSIEQQTQGNVSYDEEIQINH